ncbi:hypothetical protein [Allochromatium tepidum]|uniref:Uncharacterized protein n=1 Tax=Allochromatium tepidum TaxID=553982 RepID=A0ABN6GJA9_9GAMM|nr:hypothetical protein [Allochromatium tepidum]BCU08480.1 hypothetical protein Atep_31570 [Allochromatium tepidum]
MPKTKKNDITWKPCSPDTYTRKVSQYVHFSFKATNSNADAGGIRLGPQQGLNMPYVSARSLIEAGYDIPLDYAEGGAADAGIAKQVAAFDAGEKQPESPFEAEAIRLVMQEARETGLELNTNAVCIRQHQLLLPCDGTYVSMTPLASGGLCEIIQDRFEVHSEAAKERGELTPRLRRAFLGFGGSNSQNVGRLVRHMQKPLVFFAPQKNCDLREVLSLYYRGVTLRPSHKTMKDYRAWKNQSRPNNALARATEKGLIIEIVKSILRRADYARAVLAQNRSHLPNGGEPIISPDVYPEVQGLIDRDLRFGNWRNNTAKLIAAAIADYKFRDNFGDFAFDQETLNTISNWVSEVLE